MEHTSSVDVVYVTALYKINTYSNIELNLIDFKPFLDTDFKIIIFTDIEELEVNQFQKVLLPKSEITSFLQTDPVLPDYRNKNKDTLDFLQLMNAKTEFLHRLTIYFSLILFIYYLSIIFQNS